MNILAFDTCWKACSAACVHIDGAGESTTLAKRFAPMATGQAETLPVMLSEIFDETGLKAKDIDRIAVPNGPGSFTGVRIGIATARALKIASDADLVTCSSLAVLAYGVMKDTLKTAGSELLVVTDARRGKAYAQAFSLPGAVAKTSPQLISYSNAADLCDSESVLVVGTAANLVADAASDRGRILKAVEPDILPNALDLAERAALLLPLEGPLMPVYLRPPDAKPPTKQSIERVGT